MPSLRVVLGTAAVTLGLLALAAPAHAAPPALPEGDALYTVSCDPVTDPLQLFTLDPATGSAAPVGEGVADLGTCAYDPAWDPTTGLAYGLATVEGEVFLYSIDLSTGVSSPIGQLTDGDSMPSEGSLTIGLDGTAWFLDEGIGELYLVDLATGDLDYVGELTGLDEDVWAWGFATDPSTGNLYLLDYDGGIYLIDPEALTATLVGTTTLDIVGAYDIFGLTIDTAGTAWLISSPSGGEPNAPSGLWSTPLSSPGAAEFSGPLVDSSSDESFYSFVVFSTWGQAPAPAPAPQLAATGMDATPVIAIAGMLGLAGLVLVASRRRAA